MSLNYNGQYNYMKVHKSLSKKKHFCDNPKKWMYIYSSIVQNILVLNYIEVNMY